MSFLARLKLGENTYNVITADYEVSQQVDQNKMPMAIPKLGFINVIIESSTKVELLDWAIQNQKKNGKIIFYKKDNNATMKALDFKDAFCVQYKEIFEAEGAIPMRIILKLVAREIECMGVVRAEKWPGFKEGAAPPPNTPAGAGDSEEIVSFNPTER
jgi:hypothetical protein